ncbi:MAG TPA: hypothetical protein VFV87_03175 [Pirellulaceae bacterium]|nr:hypothetical protein [Pirellulaceae bacterium]
MAHRNVRFVHVRGEDLHGPITADSPECFHYRYAHSIVFVVYAACERCNRPRPADAAEFVNDGRSHVRVRFANPRRKDFGRQWPADFSECLRHGLSDACVVVDGARGENRSSLIAEPSKRPSGAAAEGRIRQLNRFGEQLEGLGAIHQPQCGEREFTTPRRPFPSECSLNQQHSGRPSGDGCLPQRLLGAGGQPPVLGQTIENGFRNLLIDDLRKKRGPIPRRQSERKLFPRTLAFPPHLAEPGYGHLADQRIGIAQGGY